MSFGWFGLIFILALLLVNGFLAMSEIAVISARKSRLRDWAQSGNTGSRIALELVKTPSRFLSSVQIGITLIGILAGAFSEATFAEELAGYLVGLGLKASISQALAGGMIVVVITYFSLVIGELAPKRIAMYYPEKIATRVAPVMKYISSLTTPFVFLLSTSTNLLIGLLGFKKEEEPEVTEEEVKMLIDQGTAIGVFEPIEDTIVDRVFRLGDQKAVSVTTPRTEIVWLDVEASPVEIKQKVRESDHSFLPVARGDFDHLIGYVKVTEILSQCLEQGKLDLSAAIRQPLYLPENTTVYGVLEQLRESGQEIAFIVDEYGGVEGLVTLRDLLEALVGEFPEEGENLELGIVQREDGSWLVDGQVPVQEFRQRFELDEFPDEQKNRYHTVGGFIQTSLGRVPSPGDHLHRKGLRFEVLDMDGRRVDKVLVSKSSE